MTGGVDDIPGLALRMRTKAIFGKWTSVYRAAAIGT